MKVKIINTKTRLNNINTEHYNKISNQNSIQASN